MAHDAQVERKLSGVSTGSAMYSTDTTASGTYEIEHDFKRQSFKFAVGVDDSKCSLHALQFIDELSARKDKIQIVHAPDESNVSFVQKRYQPFLDQHPKRFKFEILKNKDQKNQEIKEVNEKIMHYINQQNDKSIPDFLVTGKHGATHEVAADKPSHHHVGSFADTSLRKIRCTSIFVPRVPKLIQDEDDPWTFVVGVDGSHNSDHAFDMATYLIQTKHHHVHKKNMLHIVHVRHPSVAPQSLPPQMRADVIKARFTKMAQHFTQQTKIPAKFEIIDGDKVSQPLCDFAEEKKAQMIFVGEDGLAQTVAEKSFLGSVSDKVVKIAHCAVCVSHVNDMFTSSFSNLRI